MYYAEALPLDTLPKYDRDIFMHIRLARIHKRMRVVYIHYFMGEGRRKRKQALF
jgi:hypothetical protein